MTTSLAEQLRRLATPQTSLLKESKKQPSLLFNPKEAAALNKETFYQIGRAGLEGLILKNQLFEEFENNLFHETSKDFQRAVQTEEANKKLNKNIRKFLCLLSPYFLLYDSYKALEWLIYRFQIHEYNKDDLIMLIMPYHETNIFVRTLQLMNLKDPNDKWNWLLPLQKPGVHLPKNTFYTHVANNMYFIKFVKKFLFSMMKTYNDPSYLILTFNYYCVTYIGALEYAKEVNETHVTQMLPALLKGLDSEIPDYCAASYIILAKLVTKVDLSEKILHKFVERISKFNVDSLRKEAVTLLIIIYQSQEELKTVSQVSTLQLAICDWLPTILKELMDGKYVLKPFLVPLLRECVRNVIVNVDDLSCGNFVLNLIDSVKFEDDFVKELIWFVFICF